MSKTLLLGSLLLFGVLILSQAHKHDHSHTHSHEHTHDHSHSHSHDRRSDHSHDHLHTDNHKDEPHHEVVHLLKQFGIEGVWNLTLLATAFIGIVPIFILWFIPLVKDDGRGTKPVVNESLLKTLLGFAVGGLLGDVFLHLLPHSMPNNHSHDHSHLHETVENDTHAHDMSMGLLVLGGMMTFFVLEKILTLSEGEKSSHGHSHSHSHSETVKSEVETKKQGANNRKKNSNNNTTESSFNKESSKPKNQKEKKNFAGYLNILADTAHNFTDGMAIAASFLISPKVGISTTIAVFFHEIPHEIGDFAILIQSGFSKKQAMIVQVWTALGALFGAVVGLLAGGYIHETNTILPFTAGGFIYVATVDVIPELLHGTSLRQTIREIVAILAGVGMIMLPKRARAEEFKYDSPRKIHIPNVYKQLSPGTPSKSKNEVPVTDDNVSLEDFPNDTQVAMELLRSQWHANIMGSKIGPSLSPIILKSQLYTLVKDRTSVDKEIDLLRNCNKIRMFKLPSCPDDYACVLTKDYINQIQYIKQQMILSEKNQTSDKENIVSPNTRLITVTPKDLDVLDSYIEKILPVHFDFVISRDKLHQLIENLTEQQITLLVNVGLLVLKEVSVYFLNIPNIGPFVKSLIDGRKEIIYLLKRQKWKEIMLNDIDRKKLKNSSLSVPYIVKDQIGKGVINGVPSNMGTLLRLTDGQS